jgi:CRP-like cAMP-binding protein
MQQKQITLSRDTVLWDVGDSARSVAVIEKGRLGARAGQALVGVLLPHMVLGESALLADEGSAERRTITIFALEDNTVVAEYPVSEVKADFEAGSEELMKHILFNQTAQICRNLLMVMTSRRGQPLVDEPLGGLVRGLLADVPRVSPLKRWESSLAACRFLNELRTLSDRLLEQLGPRPEERAAMIVDVSQSLAHLSMGQDVRPIVEAFIEAERQKTDWWLRGGSR